MVLPSIYSKIKNSSSPPSTMGRARQCYVKGSDELGLGDETLSLAPVMISSRIFLMAATQRNVRGP